MSEREGGRREWGEGSKREISEDRDRLGRRQRGVTLPKTACSAYDLGGEVVKAVITHCAPNTVPSYLHPADSIIGATHDP